MKKWNTKIILITFISLTLIACGGGESEEINTDIRTEVSPTAFTKNKPNEVENYDLSIFEQPGLWVIDRVYFVNRLEYRNDWHLYGEYDDSILTAEKRLSQVRLDNQQEFIVVDSAPYDTQFLIEKSEFGYYYGTSSWCEAGILTSRYYQNENRLIQEISCDQEIIYSVSFTRLKESNGESFGSVILTIDDEETLNRNEDFSIYTKKTINLETLASSQIIRFGYNFIEGRPYFYSGAYNEIIQGDTPTHVGSITIEQFQINHAYSIVDSTNLIMYEESLRGVLTDPSMDMIRDYFWVTSYGLINGQVFGPSDLSMDRVEGEFLVWNDTKIQGNLSFSSSEYFDQQDVDFFIEFDFDLTPIFK